MATTEHNEDTADAAHQRMIEAVQNNQFHIITHPDSGIICQCVMCKNNPQKALVFSEGKIGKVYFATVRPK